MKTRYRQIRRGIRGGLYYCVDTKTGRRTSLGVSDEDEARQIIEARNKSERQPALNLHLARSYLIASDPAWSQRTWQAVMEQIQVPGKDSTQIRYQRAVKAKIFDRLRSKVPSLRQSMSGFLKLRKIPNAIYSTNCFGRSVRPKVTPPRCPRRTLIGPPKH